MNYTSGDLDKNDMDDLAQAQRDSLASDQAEQAALAAAETTESAAAPTPAPTPVPAAPAPAPVEAPAPVAAPVAAPVEAPAEAPRGDLRGALRASRHQEKLNREKADRLTRENEELRKLIPAAAPAMPVLDPKLTKDLADLAPDALAALEARDAEIERLRQQITAAPKPTPPRAEFKPDVLPDDVQELVDDLPELLTWQTSAEKQREWQAAINADIFLSETDAWKDKPVKDRLAEAVKMVKASQASGSPAPAPAPAAPTPEQIRARLDAIPVAQRPVTAGGLRSGEAPDNELPDFHQMAKSGMSDEEIMARLN